VTDSRPPIPSAIKREVRQRCGFGCVICGLPLYEYEHMAGWAKHPSHAAVEMTLLCDRHHKERTNKLLPIEVVRKANENPHNRRTGLSSGFALHYFGLRAVVTLGSNHFTAPLTERSGPLIPVLVDGVPLVSFRREDHRMLLTLELNDQEDRPLIRIVDNELVYVIDSAWDFDFVARTLIIRNGPRKIVFRVQFAVPDTLAIETATLWKNGVGIVVRDGSLSMLNAGWASKGSRFENFNAGIVVGKMLDGYAGCIVFDNVPRFRWNSSGIFALGKL